MHTKRRKGDARLRALSFARRSFEARGAAFCAPLAERAARAFAVERLELRNSLPHSAGCLRALDIGRARFTQLVVRPLHPEEEEEMTER